MNCRHIFAVATCLCLFAMSAGAAPTGLPDPWYNGGLSDNFLNSVSISSPGSYSLPFASASVFAFPNPGASITTACSSPATYPNNCVTGGNIWVVYYFAVTGGNPGDPVNVLADSLLRGALSGNAAGANSHEDMSAAITITDNANPNYVAYSIANGCIDSCSWQQNWRGTLSLAMASGDTGTVTIHITADATEVISGGIFGVGSADSYADPYIYIDPNTANAGLYGIVVSPGVGNSPLGSTPEPSSLMLLGSGVIGLAGLARRKFLC